MTYLDRLKNAWASYPESVRRYAFKEASSGLKYVSWLDVFEGDIVQRIFGFRKLSGKAVDLNEVIRRPVADKMFIGKDMYFTGMSGWRVMFKPITRTSWYGYGCFGKWMSDDHYPGITSVLLNPEKVFEVPKYKYCGYSGVGSVIEYLKHYNADNSTEYFGKLGIKYSKTMAGLAKKDRQFTKWLMQQEAKEINMFGPEATVYAYKNHVEIDAARRFLNFKHIVDRTIAQQIPSAKTLKLDNARLWEYVSDNDIDGYMYEDYISACRYLELDMKDTKVLYPYDFMRMHDLRINEKHAKEAEAEKARMEQLKLVFDQNAAIYGGWAYTDGHYTISAAKTIAEIKREGEELNHCVYKMGYHNKMAKGECVILFVRPNSDLDKPFVTVEWNFKYGGVSQCYGNHDSKPESEVKAFVDTWASWLKENVLQRRVVSA